MEDLRARPGFLESREYLGALLERTDVLHLAGKGDLFLIVDESASPQRRNFAAGSKGVNREAALVGVLQDVFVDHARSNDG
jgi:hypothetical protein